MQSPIIDSEIYNYFQKIYFFYSRKKTSIVKNRDKISSPLTMSFSYLLFLKMEGLFRKLPLKEVFKLV